MHTHTQNHTVEAPTMFNHYYYTAPITQNRPGQASQESWLEHSLAVTMLTLVSCTGHILELSLADKRSCL